MFKYNLKTSEGLFFAIAFVEGISFLILLFIAMPLKYLAGLPKMVKYVGLAHGVLFVIFGLALLWVYFDKKWSLIKVCIAFLSSLVPFGTFWFEKRCKS